MPRPLGNEFKRYLVSSAEAIRSGVIDSYADKKDAHWIIWVDFCLPRKLDPFLRNFQDPIPILEVFAAQYRDGRIAPSGNPVKSRTVEDSIRSVGQAFARMGSHDPRINKITGKIDFRLQQQLRSYARTDAPPKRVKPLPITIVLSILAEAFNGVSTSNTRRTIANMVCIAFYFCLRPGEYTGTTNDDAPFLLQDVGFYIGPRKLDNATAFDWEILAATAVTLMFTTQKNMHRNENIAHGLSGATLCCPVRATARQFLYHRHQRQRLLLPYDGKVRLASFYTPSNQIRPLQAKHVTDILRSHVGLTRSSTGLSPDDISARSLRAGGAMALLCGKVDDNVIKLLARWNSDSMMDYLHQQATPVMARLAAKMYNNGSYSFLPNEYVPVT